MNENKLWLKGSIKIVLEKIIDDEEKLNNILRLIEAYEAMEEIDKD